MSEVVSSPIRFTWAEYRRMSEAGILGGRRTELIGGRIIRMAPQMNPHRWAISKIARLFVKATTAKDWLVIEGTLHLDKNSAPEPDFHLFDVPEGTSDDKLPLPMLVIEVSHKTYRRDSGSKMRAYARAGITDYWIVNLGENRVEVYRRPRKLRGGKADWGYESVEYLAAGQSVSLLNRTKMRVAVSDLLL